MRGHPTLPPGLAGPPALLAAAALAALGVVAGCSSAPTGEHRGGAPPAVRPVQAAAPIDPPAARLSDGVCVVSRPATSPAPTGELVAVDPQPDAVTAVWIPGLNASPCATAETRGDAAAATALATALDAGPAAGTGPMDCPMEDGTAVELFFAYAGAPTEEADVNLTGCRSVSAPGRAARSAGTSLFGALATIAPAPWKADLAGDRSPVGIGPAGASPAGASPAGAAPIGTAPAETGAEISPSPASS